MMFAKLFKLNISVLCLACVLGVPAYGEEYGVQTAWDNPTANMAMGSTKPSAQIRVIRQSNREMIKPPVAAIPFPPLNFR